MPDENEPLLQVAVEATKATALEIYKDALQPAAKQVGKNLETVVKAVGIALHPLRVAVWKYEQISAYLEPALAERLEHVRPENIQPPDLTIAGPSLEALRFTVNNEELRGMFASLIATSMNVETSKSAHPSFVEVIKQLSTDEAILLKYLSEGRNWFYVSDVFQFMDGSRTTGAVVIKNLSDVTWKAECNDPRSYSFYLENLMRLEILHKEHTQHPAVEHRQFVNEVVGIMSSEVASRIANGSTELQVTHQAVEPLSIMSVSTFGSRFIGACVNANWAGIPGS